MSSSDVSATASDIAAIRPSIRYSNFSDISAVGISVSTAFPLLSYLYAFISMRLTYETIFPPLMTGTTTGHTVGPKTVLSSVSTLKKLASLSSIFVTTNIFDLFCLRASSYAFLAPTLTPDFAETVIMTVSAARIPSVISAAKSKSPGVSRILILRSLYSKAAREVLIEIFLLISSGS